MQPKSGGKVRLVSAEIERREVSQTSILPGFGPRVLFLTLRLRGRLYMGGSEDTERLANVEVIVLTPRAVTLTTVGRMKNRKWVPLISSGNGVALIRVAWHGRCF